MSPYTERVIRILRQELLDHIIPFNERPLYNLLKEYINDYYHPVRTHSSLDHKPQIFDPSVDKLKLSLNFVIEAEPVPGVLYYSYQAKAARLIFVYVVFLLAEPISASALSHPMPSEHPNSAIVSASSGLFLLIKGRFAFWKTLKGAA